MLFRSAGWLILALASSVYAFRCILPFRSSKGVHPALEHCPHFHPAAIASKYGSREFDKFIADYREAGIAGFQEQVLAGLLIDSHISAVKYAKVTSSIRLLGYRSEEHTSELQSRRNLVCRLLLEKKK